MTDTPYTPENWYWSIGGDATQYWSTDLAAYVSAASVPIGAPVSKVPTEDDLYEVLERINLEARAPAPSAGKLDEVKDEEVSGLRDNKQLRVLFEVLFEVINDVRVLKGQGTITKAQLFNYMKGLVP